jgi:hypothetical protein
MMSRKGRIRFLVWFLACSFCNKVADEEGIKIKDVYPISSLSNAVRKTN